MARCSTTMAAEMATAGVAAMEEPVRRQRGGYCFHTWVWNSIPAQEARVRLRVSIFWLHAIENGALLASFAFPCQSMFQERRQLDGVRGKAKVKAREDSEVDNLTRNSEFVVAPSAPRTEWLCNHAFQVEWKHLRLGSVHGDRVLLCAAGPPRFGTLLLKVLAWYVPRRLIPRIPTKCV